MAHTCDSTPSLCATQSFRGLAVDLFASPETDVRPTGNDGAICDCTVFVTFRNTSDVPLTLAYSGSSPLLPSHITEPASQDQTIVLPDSLDGGPALGDQQSTKFDVPPGGSWTSPTLHDPLRPALRSVRDGVSLSGDRTITRLVGAPRTLNLILRLRTLVLSATEVQPIDTTFTAIIKAYPPERQSAQSA